MSGWSPEAFGAVVVLIIGAITTGAVKIIGALKVVETKVDKLEVKVDGRLTQLLERTATASKAEGVDVGRGQMAAAIPVPAAAPSVEPSQVQPDGTMVIGLPVPTPPVLLVPIEDKGHTVE